jgi:hypothetical protein
MPLLNPELEHSGAINGHCDAYKMLSLYQLCHHLVCSYPLLPPMITQENGEQLHRRRAGMSMSTAPRDLAAIKHALELGFILAALIIATIMIVTAADGDARKLTPDITTGQGVAVMFTPALAMSTWSVQFNHPTCIWQETSEREI